MVVSRFLYSPETNTSFCVRYIIPREFPESNPFQKCACCMIMSLDCSVAPACSLSQPQVAASSLREGAVARRRLRENAQAAVVTCRTESDGIRLLQHPINIQSIPLLRIPHKHMGVSVIPKYLDIRQVLNYTFNRVFSFYINMSYRAGGSLMSFTKYKLSRLATLFGIIFFSFVTFFLSAKADSNDVSCSFTTPATAEVGETVTISYALTGGSGNYTNVYAEVFGRTWVLNSGSPIGKQEHIPLDSSAGTIELIAPAGDDLGIFIVGQDTITGENFWFIADFPLSPNSNYSLILSPEKSEYFKGESITVEYNLSGFSEVPENAYLWWAIGHDHTSPELELAKEPVLSLSGTASFSAQYGDCVVCYLSGTDSNGIPFYAKSDYIILKDIEEIPVSTLPASLTRIDSEAFTNTSILAIYIPDSIQFIADDAFSNSSILVIYGNTDYVKEYANAHNILFIEKEYPQ